MNNIQQANESTTLSSNNFNKPMICIMPIEIIDKICQYLNLDSILKISTTCKQLHSYTTRNIVLKKRYNLIYSYKPYFFTNKNTDFIDNLNKSLRNYITYLTENNLKINDAIVSINSSKLYGFHFALMSVMSEDTYSFNISNKIDVINLPNHREDNTALNFKSTNTYNEYLVIAANCLYTIDLYTENKTNNIKHIINISDFVDTTSTNIIQNILLKDDFIIIKLYQYNSIVLKKNQDTYTNITPKNISFVYGKTFLILQNSSNNHYFLVLFNNKVYKCNEKQLSAINLNLYNINSHIKDITPNNLLVSKIAASDNGNLVVFYGINSTNQMQKELHVQVDGEITNTIDIPSYNRECDLYCSPMGTSFMVKSIIVDDNSLIEDELFSTLDLYKAVNNFKIINILITYYYHDSQFKSYYETDDLVRVLSENTQLLFFIKSAHYSKYYSDTIDSKYFYRYKQKVINFNKTKNMYVEYNKNAITNIVNSAEDYQIVVHRTEKEKIYKSSIIKCKQLVNYVTFSPNSQLVITKERYDENTTVFNTLRIYRIVKKNNNDGKLYYLKVAEFIGELCINEYIENMEFHDSGFKIIVSTKDSIKILDIIKNN